MLPLKLLELPFSVRHCKYHISQIGKYQVKLIPLIFVVMEDYFFYDISHSKALFPFRWIPVDSDSWWIIFRVEENENPPGIREKLSR